MILHAGLLALYGPSGWRGVLLTGPSGSGKSDLALRCLEVGFSLVADDRVVVWTSGDSLYGAAPEPLAGLIEARGLGVLPADHRALVRIVLVAAAAAAAEPERMPERDAMDLLGRRVPKVSFSFLEASAPAKLRHALNGLGVRDQTA